MSKGTVWSDGNGTFSLVETPGQTPSAKPQKLGGMQVALAKAGGTSAGSATTVAGSFFKLGWGNVLQLAASDRVRVVCEADEHVEGADCFVISYIVNPTQMAKGRETANVVGQIGKTTTTVWIGKSDYLIHQSRQIVENVAFEVPPFSDEQIRKLAQREGKPTTPAVIATVKARLEVMRQKAKDVAKNGKTTVIQTHRNITVNKAFSAADFQR